MSVFSMIAGAVLFALAALRRKNQQNGLPLVQGRMTDEELETICKEAAAHRPDAVNWAGSIVDLLKILGQPSSLAARKELAFEYRYAGKDAPGTAAWNEWLHAETMNRLRDGRLMPPAHADED